LTTAACWLIRTSSPFRPRPKIAGCSEAGTGCNAAGDRGNRGGWRRPGEHPGPIGARWPPNTTSGGRSRRRPGSTSRPIALGRSPSPSTTVGHVAMWTRARTENTPFYLRVSFRLLSSWVHQPNVVFRVILVVPASPDSRHVMPTQARHPVWHRTC
jgi:hypothetical protein